MTVSRSSAHRLVSPSAAPFVRLDLVTSTFSLSLFFSSLASLGGKTSCPSIIFIEPLLSMIQIRLLETSAMLSRSVLRNPKGRPKLLSHSLFGLFKCLLLSWRRCCTILLVASDSDRMSVDSLKERGDEDGDEVGRCLVRFVAWVNADTECPEFDRESVAASSNSCTRLLRRILLLAISVILVL